MGSLSFGYHSDDLRQHGVAADALRADQQAAGAVDRLRARSVPNICPNKWHFLARIGP